MIPAPVLCASEIAAHHTGAFSAAFAIAGIVLGAAAIVAMMNDRRKSQAREDAMPWLYPPTPARLAKLQRKRAALTKRHAPVKAFDRGLVAERNALLRQYVDQKEEA